MSITKRNLTVGILRECFRNLESFRAAFEESQLDMVIGPGGVEISLWDLEYLYEQIERLPLRQQQAIEWFLVKGYREKEVAEMMGTAKSNSVGSYATAGLKTLIKMISDGELERFHFDRPWGKD